MNQEVSGVTLSGVFNAIRARKTRSIAIILAIPAALSTYAVIAPNVYQAVVTVAPATSNKSLGGLSSAIGQLDSLAVLTGLSVGKDAATEEAVAVLKSRAFTERFLSSSGAMSEILAARFGGRADKQYKVYRYFDSNIRSVIQNRRTGLYTVAIEWTDREKAAIWANGLVQQLNSEMRARAIREAQQNLKFLREEIAGTDQIPVRDAINRLIEAQIKQRMLASVTQEYVFRVVDPAATPAPREQIYPNRSLFAVGGIFLALCVLVSIAYVELHFRRAGNESTK